MPDRSANGNERKSTAARRAAACGVMTALAMVLSYAETLIPISIGVPGAKLGLPNIVTVLALYTVGTRAAALLSVLRIVLVGLTFGNLFSMLYSLCGFAASFAVMVLLRRSGRFGVPGVSAAAGAAHNIGQLLCAACLVKTAYVFAWLPMLLPAGVLAGVLIGLTGAVLIRRLRPSLVRWLADGALP